MEEQKPLTEKNALIRSPESRKNKIGISFATRSKKYCIISDAFYVYERVEVNFVSHRY